MTNEEIIKELSGKTVLEINDLVKALEEAWGVSAAAAVAKAIMDFVKDSAGKASVKGADYDNKIVDAAMVEALSKVPGKDQLRATLLMLLKEPATRLARVLSEKAKKGGDAAPAAEAPAPEAAPAA